jgi:hypothetical protein
LTWTPNNLWAIPAAATAGDPDDITLYAEIGKALSSWEMLEGFLGELFAVLIMPKARSLAASRAYGAIGTFRARMDMLAQAAEAHFSIRQDPSAEADFNAQRKIWLKASPRRNDIAHGVVRPFDFSSRTHSWALYPSYYTSSRRALDGSPAYVMTAKDVARFGDQFSNLCAPLIVLTERIRLFPEELQ